MNRLLRLVKPLAVLVVVVLMVSGAVGTVPTATAAGTGVLTVSITPVDYASGVAQTEAGTGLHGDKVAYRVTFTCAIATCENTTVRLAPSQPDPFGLAAQNPFAGARETLLKYETWTPPATGGSISGDDSTGKLVSLGDLLPGSGGTFQVVYNWTDTGTANVIWAPQYYPDGFDIANSATISSPTATEDRLATAPIVEWRNQLPSPGIANSLASGASVAPNTNLTYLVGMGTGALIFSGSGRIAGFARLQAAGGWYVAEKLPPQAQFVSASDGGFYDATTHSVIWNRGYDAQGTYTGPVADAGGGFGAASFSAWSQQRGYNHRSVTVTFPSTNFPAADSQGCNFEQTVAFSGQVDVTYLDSAATAKSATHSKQIVVACWEPFSRGAITKDTTSDAGAAANRLIDVPPVVTGMTCPPSGVDDWARTCTPGQPLAAFPANSEYWEVYAYNRGNVPGVATIVDDDLDHAGMPVTSIVLTPNATVDYEYRCGSAAPVAASYSGGVLALTSGQISAGCRIVSAEITSGSLGAGNIRPTDNGTGTWQRARFNYSVAPGTAVTGIPVTNTASATISYPGYPTLAPITVGPVSRSATLRDQPTVTTKPVITATVPSVPVVQGGGQAVPGSQVTFSVGGSTSSIPLNSSFVPQYVFVAPAGWQVQQGSAAFVGTVPPGVDVEYRTVTIGGVQRQVVVATWPAGTDFGKNTTLPAMTVVAQPTFAVAAGTNSSYEAWIGDSAHTWTSTTATLAGAVQDANDLDGDGSTAEWFSRSTGTILVSSADAMTILKEICSPDATKPDGCNWVSNPSAAVPVSTVADDIRYRVSIQNSGNTNLTGVVGYDVLPFVGDTGTTDASAGTPRGSQFEQTLISVSDVSSNATLAYSASTQPTRPQVYTGSGTTNDWNSTASGKHAIRVTVNGALAPGASVSFQYVAAVGAGALADSVACNSVAVFATQIGVLEPPAVCATTTEADLVAAGPVTITPQLGRPTVLPFEFAHLSGSASSPARVVIAIPADVSVPNLTVTGWNCTSPAATPIVGPAEVTCIPTAASIVRGDAPVPLHLPAIVSRVGVSITATISGPLYDPHSPNNTHTITVPSAAAAATGALTVTKTDGIPALVVGQQTTYTIEVTNPLEFETLVDVQVEDVLPAQLVFVSATGGGTHSAGTVLWTIPSIPAGGAASVSVTVQLAATTLDEIENTATVSVVDPAFPAETLDGTATDTNAIDRVTLTKSAVLSTPTGVAPRPGDVVTYSFLVTNAGGGVLSGVALQDLLPGLSAMTVPSWPGPIGELDPDESITGTATYRLTVADLDRGDLDNTATVTAGSAGGGTASGTSSVELDFAQEPALSLVKSADPGTLVSGQTVTYSFVVTNTGNVTVNNVVIDETLFTGSGTVAPITCASGSASLAPGAQVLCQTTYTITQDDVDDAQLRNTATASGTSVGGPTTSQPSSVTLPFAQDPELTLAKRADVASYDALGDVVNYTFRVTNSGNVTVSAVDVVEQSFSGSGSSPVVSCPAVPLLPGQYLDCTASPYTVLQADLDDAEIRNTAVATGTTVASGAVTSDASTVVLPFDGLVELELVKSGVGSDVNRDGIVTAGDRITWSFTATNTGVVTLTGLSVSDPTAGVVTCDATTLAPGDSTDCSVAAHTITITQASAGRVTNTATASATGAGNPVTSGQVSATVWVQALPLALTGVSAGPAQIGALVALMLLVAGLVLVRRRRAAR